MASKQLVRNERLVTNLAQETFQVSGELKILLKRDSGNRRQGGGDGESR
jgi:hypothetical protein